MGLLDDNWLGELYRICSEEPFRKKVLLADSFQQGEQRLARTVQEHGPLLGVETATLRSLVLKRTRLELAARKLTLLSGSQTYWLVQSLMRELAERGLDYIPAELLTPGMTGSFHHAVQELRGARITAAMLDASQFGSESKGIYLTELLAAYEDALERKGFLDYSGLLDVLPEGGGGESFGNALYIMGSTDRLGAAELEMLRRIAGSGLLVLGSGEPFPESLRDGRQEQVRFFGSGHNGGGAGGAEASCWRRRSAFDGAELILSDYPVGGGRRSVTEALVSPARIPWACPYRSRASGAPLSLIWTGWSPGMRWSRCWRRCGIGRFRCARMTRGWGSPRLFVHWRRAASAGGVSVMRCWRQHGRTRKLLAPEEMSGDAANDVTDEPVGR